ncbi:MAG: glycosyltransferase [Alphaproteobacteria bacterium]|nr:glycosyltransferase [Alphaproteobacteria bacterium]
MPKISVIVPVYNVEKYLPKCLESLINQTLKEIEIICVNDESPDSCDQILKEYQERDKRIIVLNQKNSGQGSARNRGLEITKGKYIQFLDSDDYFEPTCCAEMYQLMEEHPEIDVACFDTHIIYEAYADKKEGDERYFKMRYRGKQKVKPSMAHQLVDCNCWNKIFRKTFIDKYHLRFPEKLHYEDVGFLWFWITRAQYIYFYPKKLTNYLRRKGSFLGEIYEKSSQTIFDAFKVNELICRDLKKNNKWDEYKAYFIQAYLLKIRWLIKCFPKEKWRERKRLIDICADFFKTCNMQGIILANDEQRCLDNIMRRNYYAFNAFNDGDVENLCPAFGQNNVPIVFSTDRNYVPCLSVALTSVLENASPRNNYDIVVLYQDIYEYQKRFLMTLAQNRPNVSVRFFNMGDYVKEYALNKSFTVNHITFSAYFRLFVGQIFKVYEKILYLDCDLVVLKDIAELYRINIAPFPIAAVRDTTISHALTTGGFNKAAWEYFGRYMKETLDFTTPQKYFNSGVLIVDIAKFNEVDLDHLVDLVRRNNKFFHDQNVLNAAFENNYYELPICWNFQWNIKFHSHDYKSVLPPDVLAFYEDPNLCANIIHYTSHEKPWKNPYHTFADIWWQYARKSPFYEIILKENLVGKGNPVDMENSRNLSFVLAHPIYSKIKKAFYKIKKTYGKKHRRDKFQAKYNALTEAIKAAKKFKRQAKF